MMPLYNFGLQESLDSVSMCIMANTLKETGLLGTTSSELAVSLFPVALRVMYVCISVFCITINDVGIKQNNYWCSLFTLSVWLLIVMYYYNYLTFAVFCSFTSCILLLLIIIVTWNTIYRYNSLMFNNTIMYIERRGVCESEQSNQWALQKSCI